LRVAAGRAAAVALLGVLPAALLVAFLAGSVHHHPAYDFHAVWQAGHDVLHGRSPYPSVRHLEALRGTAIDEFVYPAAVAVFAAPLGMLPFGVASVLWVAAGVASVGLALWILGVRDWRCYGALLASPAMLDAVRLGTLTPMLALLIAVAWRWRDQAARCGLAVAAAIVAKVFLAPLLLWLLVTRRFRAAAIAIAATAGLLLAGWVAIGFAGLRGYPALLSTLSDVEAARSYSIAALATTAGVSIPGLALTAALAVAGIPVLVLLHRRAGDSAVLAGAVGLSLLATPILWLHYLLLVGVVIAIRRPAFSAVWLIGWLMWLSPTPESGSEPWRIGLGLLVVAASVTVAAWPQRTGQQLPSPA
jgi:hypothetical protein